MLYEDGRMDLCKKYSQLKPQRVDADVRQGAWSTQHREAYGKSGEEHLCSPLLARK